MPAASFSTTTIRKSKERLFGRLALLPVSSLSSNALLEQMEQEGALLKLPPDILVAVLGKLSPQDLLRCACCCRFLSSLCLSDCQWMTLCNPWCHLVNLADWRSYFQSARALFRFLSSSDRLVGLWTAQGGWPRGSLFLVTWGSSCLVACKVLACLDGELKLSKVFEIFGYQDGSFKVELIKKNSQSSPCARLPGKLVWDLKNASEFAVEADEQAEGFAQTISQDGIVQPDDHSFLMQLVRPHQVARVHDNGQPPGLIFPDLRVLEAQDDTSEETARARRVNLLQHLLEHRLPNDEDQHGLQESIGLGFSQRALQYLLRLSSPARNSLSLEGESDERSSTEQRRILKCTFTRLTVAEANLETEFVGLWMGLYGPHGAEIIHVTQRDEGIVVGTKVLGDPNVPCGEVSFRAQLHFERSDVPVEVQQIVDLQMRSSSRPFHIIKMYEGNGRIAGHNFRNPLWVPGHLLVSSEHQIAFLWEDVNFVVPFEKLNLDNLYQSQNGSGSIL